MVNNLFNIHVHSIISYICFNRIFIVTERELFKFESFNNGAKSREEVSL